MSLQGSLETFELPDVLVLLASTKKDGELRVVGGSGGKVDGRLWVEKGQVVHSEINGHDAASVDAVFELLRLETGTFSFESDSPAPKRHEPDIVDLVLADAQVRLGEWKEIAKVVPHLDVLVDMADDAPADEVTITSAEWGFLRAVAGGCTVNELMRKLGRSEFDTCKSVKELVDVCLVSIDVSNRPKADPAPAPAPEAAASPAVDAGGDDDGARHLADDRPAKLGDHDGGERAHGIDDGEERRVPGAAREKSAAERELDALVDEAARPRKVRATTSSTSGTAPAPAADRDAPAEPVSELVEAVPEAKTLVAQLAALEGENEDKIAKKVEEHLARGGELPEVPEGDEPINRGLLLKFLSSVRN